MSGRIARRAPLAVDDLRLAKRAHRTADQGDTAGAVPADARDVRPGVTRAVYPTKEDLAEDIVRILREELAELRRRGSRFRPARRTRADASWHSHPGGTRTFMCAALAARKDPAEELELAVSLINRVVDGFDGMRTGVHVCRGNWSRDESTLLSGSYRPLAPYLERLNVRNWCSNTRPSARATCRSAARKLASVSSTREPTVSNRPRRSSTRSSSAASSIRPIASFSILTAASARSPDRPVNNSDIAASKHRALIAAAADPAHPGPQCADYVKAARQAAVDKVDHAGSLRELTRAPGSRRVSDIGPSPDTMRIELLLVRSLLLALVGVGRPISVHLSGPRFTESEPAVWAMNRSSVFSWS